MEQKCIYLHELFKIINSKMSVMLVVHSMRGLNHSDGRQKVLQTFLLTVNTQV